MTADLAVWLRQQLDEDERRAMGLKSWAQGADFGVFIGDSLIGPFGGQSPIRNWGTGNDIAHLADPARVLRRIAAYKQLLDEHPPTLGYDGSNIDGTVCGNCASVATDGGLEGDPYPCRTLRLLAAEYADHPDYRQEWKP